MRSCAIAGSEIAAAGQRSLLKLRPNILLLPILWLMIARSEFKCAVRPLLPVASRRSSESSYICSTSGLKRSYMRFSFHFAGWAVTGSPFPPRGSSVLG